MQGGNFHSGCSAWLGLFDLKPNIQLLKLLNFDPWMPSWPFLLAGSMPWVLISYSTQVTQWGFWPQPQATISYWVNWINSRVNSDLNWPFCALLIRYGSPSILPPRLKCFDSMSVSTEQSSSLLFLGCVCMGLAMFSQQWILTQLNKSRGNNSCCTSFCV